MKILLSLSILSLASLPLARAEVDTADFYKCENRVSGEWNFGRAPHACDGSAFGLDSVVKRDYGAVIFRDDDERSPERERYVEELHATIRDAASYYILKRKPGASAAEVDAFRFAVITTAAHESYLSHYRLASDGRYKQMRGDYGHGHGLMQVDDRHHFQAIEAGLGWNLLGNLAYAMDLFYSKWQLAASADCVSSPGNWEARTRAAWGAYNGGNDSLCRWRNPNHKWYKNDVNFYASYSKKSWQAYVENLDKASGVNVSCLMEKRENCPVPGEIVIPALREDVLYRTSDEKPCVFKGGSLHCTEDFRDALCLRAISNFADENALVISLADYPNTKVEERDRHALCTSFDSSLLKVGSFLALKVNLNVRATPGGVLTGTLPKGSVAEVIDFELRDLNARERYYQVKVEGMTGWIYAGTPASQADWVVKTSAPLPSVLARAGESVQVIIDGGIKMRSSPGGAYIHTVPEGTKLVVQEYVIQGSVNDVYYKVTHNKKTGYLYSGALLPKESVSQWTKRIP